MILQKNHAFHVSRDFECEFDSAVFADPRRGNFTVRANMKAGCVLKLRYKRRADFYFCQIIVMRIVADSGECLYEQLLISPQK